METDRIVFKGDVHEYRRASDNKRLINTTSLIGRYMAEFPRDHLLTKKAFEELMGKKLYDQAKDSWYQMNRHLLDPEFLVHLESVLLLENPKKIKLLKDVKSNIEKSWELEAGRGKQKGHIYHKSKEDTTYENKEDVNPYNLLKYPVYMKIRQPDMNESLDWNLGNLMPGCYPELLVWVLFKEPVYDEIYQEEVIGVAGQVDKAFISIVDGVKWLDISDYKTDKKSNLKNKIYWKNYGYQYMRHPLTSFVSCTWSKYTLQLSSYAYFMELFNFKVRSLTIEHMNNYLSVEYRKNAVRKMISYYIFENGGNFWKTW